MKYNGTNVKMYNENSVFSVIERISEDDYPLHWHNNFEIELITGGNGFQILNGKKYKLKKGAFYILNHTDFHEVHPNGTIQLINVRFDETVLNHDIMREFLIHSHNSLFYADAEEYKQLCLLFKMLLNEYKNKNEYSENVIPNLLECILVFAARKFKHTPQKTAQNRSTVQQALLYLHSRFRENPSLEDTAHMLSVNPNYLSSLFHKETGTTYKKYITDMRINYAKKLVVSTSLPITEICYACGFSSLSHFLRVFKAHFGSAPGQIRCENQ